MNYYNENDEQAAEWLRQLIGRGVIPAGDVDTRSICDVRPRDLRGYTQCHFFAGIGGWSEALRIAGWPAARPVWTGSCPCQPFSSAGKGLGAADERHLWPVFYELIRQCRPEFVFGEQVASAIGKGWLDGVSADLEAAGYACGAAVLGAHSLGAPHIRQRLFWCGLADGAGAPGAQQWDESRKGSRRRPPTKDAAECEGFGGGLAIHKGQGWEGVESGEPAGFGLGAWVGGCGADGARLEQPDVCGREAGESAAEGTRYGRAAESDGGGPAGCVGDSDSAQADAAEPGQSMPGQGLPADGGGGGLGNAGDDGQRGGGREGADVSGEPGDWSLCRYIQCRDGKVRRIPVEPEFFPLADGVPGRVGLLRGYGNAIVPAVAAAFIATVGEWGY